MSRGKPFQACDLTGQSPDNCHWVDMKVQANNRRPAKKEKSRPQRRKRRANQYHSYCHACGKKLAWGCGKGGRR